MSQSSSCRWIWPLGVSGGVRKRRQKGPHAEWEEGWRAVRAEDAGDPALQPKSKGTRAQTRDGLPHPWPGLSLLVPNTRSQPNTGGCHPPGTSSEGLRDQALITAT